MTPTDLAGLLGALLILAAYAGVQLEKLNPHAAPALLLNLAGAGLVLLSLLYRFNLGAALLEGAWALIAIYGLIRLVLRRKGLP